MNSDARLFYQWDRKRVGLLGVPSLSQEHLLRFDVFVLGCGLEGWSSKLKGGNVMTDFVNGLDRHNLQRNEYTRYDVASDRVDERDDQGNPFLRPIQGNWPGLFTEDIDAAVFGPAPPPHGGEPKTVVYFFKGNRLRAIGRTSNFPMGWREP
ncbi:MAG: hypothetical protein OJF47_003794 [Nitrospira sp.]|nr:MAG: hypothetical protein OJF47_003794 [Nitrospira sp.]